MKVYVATGLDNVAAAQNAIAVLKQHGHTITYDWTAHGYIGDDDPQEKAKVAHSELVGVLNADILLMIMPGNRGTHFEFGAFYVGAISSSKYEKHIIIINDNPANLPSFHFLSGVRRCRDLQEAMLIINSISPRVL